MQLSRKIYQKSRCLFYKCSLNILLSYQIKVVTIKCQRSLLIFFAYVSCSRVKFKFESESFYCFVLLHESLSCVVFCFLLIATNFKTINNFFYSFIITCKVWCFNSGFNHEKTLQRKLKLCTVNRSMLIAILHIIISLLSLSFFTRHGCE